MIKCSRSAKMQWLIPFVAILALASCATPNVDKTYMLSESSGKGVAVGTIVSFGVHAEYRLYYREIGGGEAGFFRLHSQDPSLNGALFAVELPAGDYEIYHWHIYQDFGGEIFGEIWPPESVRIPFHVSSGEAVYIGRCTFRLIYGPNWRVRRSDVECAKWPDEDLLLLQQRYPSLTSIVGSAGADLLYLSRDFKVSGSFGSSKVLLCRPMDADDPVCE
jgi:hypothetical protein